MAELMSTPTNKLSRENLTVLISIMNNSIEYISNYDCDVMETDSPISKPKGLPIGKKLFNSPMNDWPNEVILARNSLKHTSRLKKRKQMLIPEISNERIQEVYITECDKNKYSSDTKEGVKRQVISLLYNKRYSMELNR